LTLNLGIRYDLSTNAFANDVVIEPWMVQRSDDTNNIQPRLGFAYRLNDRTVLRGGSGTYYQDPLTVDTMWSLSQTQISVIGIANDGRPDFTIDPFNGPRPTYDEAQLAFCHANGGAPGCLVRDLTEISAPQEYMTLTKNWQSSVGIQRQFGDVMALEMDYVYTRSNNEKQILGNANLGFDPATGVNFPFEDEASRPFPEWGVVSMIPHTAKSRYHGLQMGFTKRLSNSWQASATYTLAGLWDAEPQPFSGLTPVPFEVPGYLGNELTLASADQRHRAVVNAIWQVGYGFQVSAINIYGSGGRSGTSYGGDFCDCGLSNRLRPDGTVVPRNNFVQGATNRTDLRLQQRIPLGGRVSVDGIAEVFNLFNRPNWTVNTQESSRNFMQRTSGQNRTMQFGFRLSF
jgi:hypothetical protein